MGKLKIMWPNGNFRNHKTLISDYENYEYGATESIWLTVAIRKKSHRRIFFLPTGKNPNSQEVAKRFKNIGHGKNSLGFPNILFLRFLARIVEYQLDLDKILPPT